MKLESHFIKFFVGLQHDLYFRFVLENPILTSLQLFTEVEAAKQRCKYPSLATDTGEQYF